MASRVRFQGPPPTALGIAHWVMHIGNDHWSSTEADVCISLHRAPITQCSAAARREGARAAAATRSHDGVRGWKRLGPLNWVQWEPVPLGSSPQSALLSPIMCMRRIRAQCLTTIRLVLPQSRHFRCDMARPMHDTDEGLFSASSPTSQYAVAA